LDILLSEAFIVSEETKKSPSGYLEELEQATGNNYACCYQCGKCTAGCPAGNLMDNPPTRMMRLVQSGRIEEALKSDALWYCLGCQTCTARCPQSMDVAATMDKLRAMAIEKGIISEDKVRKLVEAFHISCLNTVRKHGRLQELALVNSYKLRTGTFLQDVDAGIKMMLQGKINPLSIVLGGEKVKHQDQIDKIFALAEKPDHTAAAKRKPGKVEIKTRGEVKINPMKRLGYYPGCSLSGTAMEFDISTKKMCNLLGLSLEEVEDWNCCGASSAHATNHKLSLLLPARNQVLADHQGLDYVLTPCASCLNRQIIARNALRESKELRDEIKEITGLEPTFKADFINPIQLLFGLDPEFIKSKVTHPLRDLKLACYYGCLLVRPNNWMGFDDPENPTKMEKLMQALGATPVDWAMKVECCGAGLTMAQPKVIQELTHKITRNAAANGAKAFVVACPLCHSNLDMRQAGMRKQFGDLEPMPVYYISELVAIACGADPHEVAIGKHFVPALELVSK
jgi:heterodisulfide reductase subunit B2